MLSIQADDEIRETLRALMEKHRIPAISVAVIFSAERKADGVNIELQPGLRLIERYTNNKMRGFKTRVKGYQR